MYCCLYISPFFVNRTKWVRMDVSFEAMVLICSPLGSTWRLAFNRQSECQKLRSSTSKLIIKPFLQSLQSFSVEDFRSRATIISVACGFFWHRLLNRWNSLDNRYEHYRHFVGLIEVSGSQSMPVFYRGSLCDIYSLRFLDLLLIAEITQNVD